MDNKRLGLLLVLFGWIVLSIVDLKRVSANEAGCKSEETQNKFQDCASFFPLCGDYFLSVYKHLCAKQKRRDNSGIICTIDVFAAWYTAVSTKVVQKSVKAYATMPKGCLRNSNKNLKAQNPFCFF